MLKDKIKETTKNFEERKLSSEEIYNINQDIKNKMEISKREYIKRNAKSEIEGNKIYLNC